MGASGERAGVDLEAAEFDLYADRYYEQHSRNIAISGEEPEFFAEYKVADAKHFVTRARAHPMTILDFGSGIGSSVPYFRKYFPGSELVCADTSRRSLEIAGQRYPGPERALLVDSKAPLAVPAEYFDLCFTACVFHHIPHDRHPFWLRELRRVTKPGGMLVLFEHNPLNPLTVAAVKACPFDADAHLIATKALAEKVRSAGWTLVRHEYRVFFPHFLSLLRPLEALLGRVPLGAQYSIRAINAHRPTAS